MQQHNKLAKDNMSSLTSQEAKIDLSCILSAFANKFSFRFSHLLRSSQCFRHDDGTDKLANLFFGAR